MGGEGRRVALVACASFSFPYPHAMQIFSDGDEDHGDLIDDRV